MQTATEQLARIVIQQAPFGAEDFQVAAILVEHHEQVGHGLGDGAQPGFAEAQGLLDLVALQQILEQDAEGCGGDGQRQQRWQGSFPYGGGAEPVGQHQCNQRQRAKVQQHAEREQLPEADAEQSLAVCTAVCETEHDGQQHVGQPRDYAGPAQPEAIGASQGAGDHCHQRPAEQPGHAQHHGARIEDDSGLADAGDQHADDAGAAEPESGEQLSGELTAPVPAAGGKGQQPAQREQHDRVLYDGIESQDRILGRNRPLQDGEMAICQYPISTATE